ncbi:3-phosphoserine/phosphohydroxythreonine transaminase [Candidatus Laterigemmans baculatus]|uniref:3-phosphoserine/phosphohydroxythreonine transaminase n=1 Tax=Candidatus Laterigemmans baculatus TaxID=2770505 RepID=UPI00193C7573|nr:3-phosphoserine/phosphohydroxythreonine transaminase [Candidatus Laterigemmans baculatus]
MTTQDLAQRIFNFSAGPAALPVSVLEQVRDEMLCLPGAGSSLLEMSHRDKQFVDILHAAEADLRQLLSISDDYAVLFLQGGSRFQFSMIPANLLRGTQKTAHYLVTGSWSKSAIAEAVKEGAIEKVWDGAEKNYSTLPSAGELRIPDDSAYLYYCSNETIQGVQFQSEPACPAGVPLVCDASSDFLSRPLEVDRYGILYACAQKNAGPAGVTVVIIRRDLLPLGSADLPGYMLYRNHAENDSEWNTPPTFAIYVLGLVAKWLQREVGGLDAMAQQNREKADLLYSVIDEYSDFYQGHAARDVRSRMNVTFRLPDDESQGRFLAGAAEQQLGNLKGHRSVGGIRASIYNAMPREGVQTLADFMRSFASQG